MKWTIHLALVGFSCALASCDKAPSSVVTPAATPTPAVADQPTDVDIAQGIRQMYMKQCGHAVLLDVHPQYLASSNVVTSVRNVRDSVLTALSAADHFQKLGHQRETWMQDSGEETSWADTYSYIPLNSTPDNAEYFKAEIMKYSKIDNNPIVKITGCPFVPDTITIIDHDVDPNSTKVLNIRFQRTYKISRLLEFLWSIPGTAPFLNNFSNQIPQMTSGQAVLRKTDVLGWQLESVTGDMGYHAL